MAIHQVLDTNQIRKICLVLLKIKVLQPVLLAGHNVQFTPSRYMPERGWMLQSSYLSLLQGREMIYAIFQINFENLLKRKC